MYSKRHLPDVEQWSQSSDSNVIPRRARAGLAGLRPHISVLNSLKVERKYQRAPPRYARPAPAPISRRFKINYFIEMCSGSEEGSYLRRIDFCITQLSS